MFKKLLSWIKGETPFSTFVEKKPDYSIGGCWGHHISWFDRDQFGEVSPIMIYPIDHENNLPIFSESGIH